MIKEQGLSVGQVCQSEVPSIFRLPSDENYAAIIF